MCTQVIDSLKAGHQGMVFVHSRKDTGKTGRTIIQKAQNSSDTGLFDVTEHPQWAFASRDVKKSRNKCAKLHSSLSHTHFEHYIHTSSQWCVHQQNMHLFHRLETLVLMV
jgi:replicative superfamily II helicase